MGVVLEFLGVLILSFIIGYLLGMLIGIFFTMFGEVEIEDIERFAILCAAACITYSVLHTFNILGM